MRLKSAKIGSTVVKAKFPKILDGTLKEILAMIVAAFEYAHIVFDAFLIIALILYIIEVIVKKRNKLKELIKENLKFASLLWVSITVLIIALMLIADGRVPDLLDFIGVFIIILIYSFVWFLIALYNGPKCIYFLIFCIYASIRYGKLPFTITRYYGLWYLL